MPKIDIEWVQQRVKDLQNAKFPASQDVVEHAINEELYRLRLGERIANPNQEIKITLSYN